MSNVTDTQFISEVQQMFANVLSEVDTNTTGNYNFEQDIETGEQGEDFVKNFLISKGFEFKSSNKDYRYDLLMAYNSKNITYEVKTDVLVSPESDTGNIAIEFECRGKASGIDITEADYFVTYFPKLKEIWNIQTSKLKALISSNNFKQTMGSGDEGSNTRLYLIPREIFKSNFKVYSV